MNIKIPLIILILISCKNLKAQDIKKLIVAVPRFEVSNQNDISRQTVSAIEQQVIDVFVNNKKFTVLERTQLELLNNEVDLQKQKSFINGKGNISNLIKNTGARFLLTGVISNLNYSSEIKEEKKRDNKFKVLSTSSYTAVFCTISFNLKLIDVTTGEILNSKVINAKNLVSKNASSGGGIISAILNSQREGAENQTSAYNDALKSIPSHVQNFVKESFPNVLEIAEISEKDRYGYAKSILLLGEFVDYIFEGQKLYVKLKIEMDVGGKKITRNKTIGELKVIQIEEDGFVNVKVKSGEKEITEAYQNKNKIQISEIE
jgi:curli biogenesis system outer membrane secretion channel CsgG